MNKRNNECVTIFSSRFGDLTTNIDQLMDETLRTLEEKGGNEAEITVKLKITMHECRVVDESGVGERVAKIPSFAHKCTSVMKLQSQYSGTIISDGCEIVRDETCGWVMRPIAPEQMSIFDEEERT